MGGEAISPSDPQPGESGSSNTYRRGPCAVNAARRGGVFEKCRRHLLSGSGSRLGELILGEPAVGVAHDTASRMPRPPRGVPHGARLRHVAVRAHLRRAVHVMGRCVRVLHAACETFAWRCHGSGVAVRTMATHPTKSARSTPTARTITFGADHSMLVSSWIRSRISGANCAIV